MTGLQSPEFLSDLYRDLRDRRLLPVIVVLVAAIAIVPIALSSKSKSTPAPPPASQPVVAKSDVPAAQVQISNPGVRDFHRRLSGDSPKNPFTPAFTAPVSDSGSTSSGAGGTSAGTSGSSTTAGSTSTSTPTGSTGATTGTSTNPPSGTPQPQTENKYFFYRVKVRSGPLVGKMTVHDNVKAVTSLPSKQVPALAFLGVTTSNDFNAQSAVFLVNNGVSLVTGNGTCTLTGTQCQLLSLKPGEHADLTWTDGATYRVTLVKFNLITRNKLPGAQGSDGGNAGPGTSGRDDAGWQGPGSHNFSF